MDQSVVSGCNFLTTVIVGRVLPAPAFGLFSLAFLTCLFLSNLHRAGLTQPLNVLGASDDEDRLKRRLATLLRLNVLLLPLVACMLAIASLYYFPDALLAASAIAYISCFGLQETLRRYWYTRATIQEAFWNDLLSYGGQVAALLALAGVGQLTADTALLAMGFTSLLAFVVGVRRLGAAAYSPAQPLRSLIAEHWPLSKWLLLTVLAVWGAGQVYPLLMMPLGAAAVGSFAACRNLLSATGLIVQSMGNYLPAHAASTLHNSGLAALRRQLRRTCAWGLTGGLAFLLVVHLYAESLLNLVYGGQYDDAAHVLRVLAFGACCLLGSILGAYALAMKDSRSSFFSNLGASLITFTLGLWLIDTYGLEGVALGAALSMATAMTLQGGLLAFRLHQMTV